ncbi:MAG: response regulator [Alphaproteobacteria bacterium]|nr:response regulator [Alphaproteobacteria bacterium]
MAKILVAEDDPSMRQFIVSALERVGHRVTSAADGLEALQALEQSPDTHVLLADIVMPGMDGIELARQAGHRWPHLKIMFITGFAGVSMGDKPGETSPARILSKPFHLGDLVKQVDDLLGE